MFKLKKPSAPAELSGLDKVIADAEHAMISLTIATPEYKLAVKELTKLYAIKKEASTSTRRVSPDTVALIVGNILVTAMVVGHERANVVTSKALQFALKAK